MNELLSNYQTELDRYLSELEKIKTKDQITGWSRLIFVALILYGIYGFLTSDPLTYSIVIGISLVLFLVLLNFHFKIKEKRKDIQALVTIHNREINYLQGQYDELPTGEQYIDHSHIYSSDLNLFGEYSLFRHINRSSTYVGEQKLVQLLSKGDVEDIKLNQEAIIEAGNKYDFRMNFMKHGVKNEYTENIETHAAQWINQDFKRNFIFHKAVYFLLALLSIGSFIFFLTSLTYPSFYLFLFLFGSNLAIGNHVMKKIEPYLKLIQATGKAIDTYSNLIKEIEDEEFDSYYLGKFKLDLTAQTGTKVSAKLATFQKLLNTYETRDNAVGAALFNGFLMFYVHVFNQIENWKTENKDLLLTWLDIVSTYDIYVSLGTYAYHHPEFSYPEISEANEFTAIDIKHPLMPYEQSVGNDLKLDAQNFVILTGSNMSGKSTFLRTIGLNMLLFKIGCPTNAQSFTSYPYTIATSMNVADELSENTSFFLAEIKRLQAIQATIKESDYTFLLLDEILRGTNSDDKRNGTIKFLKKLSQEPVMGLIATHDIEVAELEDERDLNFTNYYFESQLVGNELEFDYKIRKGVCHSPNATLLLEIKGIIPKDGN